MSAFLERMKSWKADCPVQGTQLLYIPWGSGAVLKLCHLLPLAVRYYAQFAL